MPEVERGNQPTVSCVFCGIVSGTLASEIIFEDDRTMALLDIAPATAGHTLVVPKRHTGDLMSASLDDLAAVTRTTQAMAKLLDQRLRPDGLTVFQSNRSAGWQDVFHLHFHVVPRWKDDSLVRPWKGRPARADELRAVSAKLRGM
jgi:histidine triad (HIT) family protein